MKPKRTMSLHAQISPEAEQRLKSSKRNSTIASLLMSFVVIVLVGLVLALVFLPSFMKEHEVIVTYHQPGLAEDPINSKKMSVQRPKPSAPSASAAARVIAANVASPMAVEVPDVVTEALLFDSGVDDFGEGGLGDGDGVGGAGEGGGGGFGTTGALPGALSGRLYDFKKGPDGTKVNYNIANPADFFDRVNRLQKSRFSEGALGRYFQAPNLLNLSHLMIPLSPASEGPKHFGAEGVIEPSGWIAHYEGKVVAPRDGSFRFSGIGDDYVVVMVNGKMRLMASRPDTQQSVVGRWTPTEPVGKHLGPFQNDAHLVYGDWIKMRKGEVLELDLVIGERPGGMLGFILQVEEKGRDYREASNGRPVLPLFTTRPFSAEEVETMRGQLGSYEVEWEDVPVFGVEGR